MGDAPASYEGSAGPVRVRVRTPGKHIVLFSLAVTFMIAISTLVLSRADFTLRNSPFAPAVEPPVEETFVADLSPDAMGRLRLLRVAVEIEASSAGARLALGGKRAELRERLAFYLRELAPEDLDGSEAEARFKAELLRRVNLTIAPEVADAVHVKSLVIQ